MYRSVDEPSASRIRLCGYCKARISPGRCYTAWLLLMVPLAVLLPLVAMGIDIPYPKTALIIAAMVFGVGLVAHVKAVEWRVVE